MFRGLRRRGVSLVLLLISAGLPLSGQAQETGAITGQVVDTSTGAAVPQAVVRLPATGESTTTNLSGNFSLSAVPEGAQVLVVEKEGFGVATVTDLAVTAGATARIDVPLSPAGEDVLQMSAFTVEADILQESSLGLLITRQRAVSVSDAIASDEMARLGVSDAAEALAKTPGTTILDGRYVVIRGLGDRYTNTQMNGSTVPSADPDRRAVQVDQFPADLIDSITTYKSFTPDQPGAFSGGSVNIRTKTIPDHLFASVSVSTAYNSNATGEDILTVPGGGRDWLGRDDGTRGLGDIPNPIPSNLTTTAAQLAARRGDFGPARELDRISRAFHNDTFFPRSSKADPDYGFGASFGNRHEFENGQVVGYIASLTYDRSTDHYANGITGRYSQGSVDPNNPRFVDINRVFTPNVEEYNFADLYAANPEVPGGPPAFGVTRSAQNVNWGAYLQLGWQPTLNHEVTATVYHNQSASDQVRRGIGEAVRSDSGGEFRENYDLLYTERGVSSLQLGGKSNLPNWNDATLEWRAAVSRSTQDQPDYRSMEFKWSFILQAFDPSGLNNYRYFRELEEDARDLGLDLTRTFDLAGDQQLTVKVGGAYFDSDRTNRERAFVVQGASNRTREGIENFPNPVGIVEETPTSVRFGTVMREISANLNYNGEQTFSAGYAMGDWQWTDQWRLIGGARLERTEILTESLPGSSVSVPPGEIRQTDALPALALVWSPTQGQNVRLSYGRTLARPTFRELAGVVNYEPFTDEFIGGNPDLELTLIDNFDLRWEWFPRGGEVIAASLFFKQLDQPIEQAFTMGRIFPRNVEEGQAYGLELEARKSLGTFHPSLEGLSVGANLSVIESKVTIPAEELALIRAVFPDASDKRELFGQSPYIVNVDATYALPRWDASLTAVFGVFGERLDLVTTGALPDVYEQPAPALDLIWSQRLGTAWRLKLTARNLLDPDRESTLEHNGREYFYERYTRGRSFSVSLSYSFN